MPNTAAATPSPFAGLTVTEDAPIKRAPRPRQANPLQPVFDQGAKSRNPLGFNVPTEEDSKSAESLLRRAASVAGVGLKVTRENKGKDGWRVRFQVTDKRRYTRV